MDIQVTDTTSESPKAVSQKANAPNSMHISFITYKNCNLLYHFNKQCNINTVLEAARFQDRTTSYRAAIPVALLK